MTAPAESQHNNKCWAQLPAPRPVKDGALAELRCWGCGETGTFDVLTSPADFQQLAAEVTEREAPYPQGVCQ
jgi:hypothetical protein